ncbi:MAG TPA: response regulator transcription factor [Bacteroidales bacterium]|nr:response regulator transcription factor [Bacteroidales bacterium]
MADVMKILICEDNKLAARAISVVLEREGYETTTAADGNLAIKMLKDNTYDLVIIDIHLPYHSGLELVKYLRIDLHKKTPVLVVSAFSDPQMQRQAGELGVNGYIIKPFNPDELVRMISAVIKQ